MNLLACFTTSACIEKPVQSAIGSVRRGMCRGTKPTLMLSMTAVSKRSSLTCLGVSPEGSTDRNGPLALSEANRDVLSLRAGGGVDGSLLARGRDVDSDFRTPLGKSTLKIGEEGYSQLAWDVLVSLIAE